VKWMEAQPVADYGALVVVRVVATTATRSAGRPSAVSQRAESG
jgi:hypothetical protein